MNLRTAKALADRRAQEVGFAWVVRLEGIHGYIVVEAESIKQRPTTAIYYQASKLPLSMVSIEIAGEPYINLKTGKKYLKITEGRNCTNAQDGQAMVMYCPADCPEDFLFREKEEFNLKFRKETQDVPAPVDL